MKGGEIHMYGILGATSSVGVGSMLSDVQSDMLSQIGSALPYAGGVFAVVAGIGIGIKLFKRVTGARS